MLALWTQAWPAIKDYLPLVALLVAVAIPLSSSFFGAWTAQRIADRNRFREDITKEIRNTNAAISLAYAVCNTAIALKRQHTARLKMEFDQAKTEFVEHFRRREIGQIQGNAVYRFTLPLMTLTPPVFAVDSLRSMVLDRISTVGRPLSLAIELAQSCSLLTDCIVARNEQIATIKRDDWLNKENGAPRFFGLPFDGGHRDQTIEETLTAILHTNDDVIFFAHLLCLDLQRYGAKLIDRYNSRLGSSSLPRITSIDFSDRIADGSVPPEASYLDWVNGFKEHDVATK